MFCLSVCMVTLIKVAKHGGHTGFIVVCVRACVHVWERKRVCGHVLNQAGRLIPWRFLLYFIMSKYLDLPSSLRFFPRISGLFLYTLPLQWSAACSLWCCWLHNCCCGASGLLCAEESYGPILRAIVQALLVNNSPAAAIHLWRLRISTPQH